MQDADEPRGEQPTRRAARAAKPQKPAVLGGVLVSLRRHRRSWIIAAACVGFALLASGVVAVGAAVGSPATASVVTSSSATPSATPTAAPRPTPSSIVPASRLRTCSVAALAADPRLGTMEAQVRNAKTGEVLFDRNGDKPSTTASVMKVVTSAAALKVLGPDYRVSTTVVTDPANPNAIILVGGGDSTLSRLPSGEQSYYTGAAHIGDLAAQAVATWKQLYPAQTITTVYTDTSLFGAPYWQPTWNEHEERFVDGSSSYVTALQVDGDRANPQAMDSTRGSDPVTVAADAFIGYVGGGVTYAGELKTPAGATQLAAVQSQPVSALIKQAVTDSDNTIMEMLTRLVAIKTGAGNTFSAENQGVLTGLAGYGIPTTGLHIADGSGLSDQNMVPPSYLTQLFIKVLNGDSGLGAVYQGLPVSGETGTLAARYGRFTGANAIARGAINAKTGSVDTGYSLAGIVHAKDGTALTFAIYAFGNVNDSAMTAIDTFAAGLFTCGDNLSNN